MYLLIFSVPVTTPESTWSLRPKEKSFVKGVPSLFTNHIILLNHGSFGMNFDSYNISLK
jgi:hypothetical protein